MTAWEHVPGHADLLAVRDRVNRLPADIPRASSVAEVQAAVINRLIAGEDLTGAQIVDEMARAQLGQAPVEAAAGLCKNAQLLIANQIKVFETTRANVDAALSWLNSEVEDLFDIVRAVVKTLGRITTPEQAMRAGSRQVAAWTSLDDAVIRYRAIRNQQHEIVVGTYNRGSEPRAREDIARFGLVRNARKHPPLVNEVAAVPPTLRVTPGREHLAFADVPWPTDDDRAFLLWCAPNNVQPWVPTLTELHSEMEAHRDAIAEAAEARAHPERERLRAAAARKEAQEDRMIAGLHAEAQLRAEYAAANGQLPELPPFA